MRTSLILILVVIASAVHAQDIVIGGYNPTRSSVAKYDSLHNFYGGIENAQRMIGQEFTYYNMLDYTLPWLQIPYPWKDGRLRSGRYTSSQAAKDAYLAELKKKSGSKYTLTDFVTYEGQSGYIFTDVTGESIFYPNVHFVGREFVCEAYKEKCQKTFVGDEVFLYVGQNGRDLNWLPTQPIEVNNCFVSIKTREFRLFPNKSKWIIVGIGVDTTHWENYMTERNTCSDCIPLVFILHNEEFGDYEYYVSSYLNLESDSKMWTPEPPFIPLKSLLWNPQPWGNDIPTGDWGERIPSDILYDAQKGDPDAMYAILHYTRDAKYNPAYFINFSYNDHISLLNMAIDSGFIHNKTTDLLLSVARLYMPCNVELEECDKNNDFLKGIPYFVKAAKFGCSEAVATLITCIERGKTDDNNVYQVLCEQAKKGSADVQMFLGRQLLKGVKLDNQEEIISWMMQIAASYSKHKKDAYYILSICYKDGIGVEKDANKWFEMLAAAANNDNIHACLDLGEIYYLGDATQKDFDKAAYYIEKGIRLESRSITNIDFKYHFMLGDIFASQGNIMSIPNFENALSTNSPKSYEAAIELGKIYYDGKIIEQNKRLAAYYFRDAYIRGGLEEGKLLFEQYQLNDELIQYFEEELRFPKELKEELLNGLKKEE